MTAKTAAQRKRDERSRKRALGLIQIQVWVKPEQKQRALEIIEALNNQPSTKP